MTEEHTISIYEKGTWKLLEIVDYRRIPHTRYTEYPQYAFDTKDDKGTITTIWIGENQSTGSKYFSFLTAATGNFLLEVGDKINPEKLINKKIMGLWGKETRTKKDPVDAFLRFLPCSGEDAAFEKADEIAETVKTEKPIEEEEKKEPEKAPSKEERKPPTIEENIGLEKFM